MKLPRFTKSRSRIYTTGAIALLIAIVFIRFVSAVYRYETGPETVEAHIRAATFPWSGWPPRPIQERTPAEQAEFWLKEIDRIIEAHPDSAEIHMGAALVLREPFWDYRLFNDQTSKYDWFGKSSSVAFSDFEDNCGSRSLELAERATEIDPNNPHWWRIWTQLFIHHVQRDRTLKTKNHDWTRILANASKHDTGNGLYDYLAAYLLWSPSQLYPGGPVTDDELFERGIACFDRANVMSLFTSYNRANFAVTRVLRLARIQPFCRDAFSRAALDRELSYIHWQVFDHLTDSQKGRIYRSLDDDDFPAAIRLWRQLLALHERKLSDTLLLRHKEDPSYEFYWCIYSFRQHVDSKKPQPADRIEINKICRQALRYFVLHKKIHAKLNSAAKRSTPVKYTLPDIARYTAATTSSRLFLPSTAGGIVLLLLSFGLTRKNDLGIPRLKVRFQVSIWIGTFLISWNLFGLAPAFWATNTWHVLVWRVLLLLGLVTLISAILAIVSSAFIAGSSRHWNWRVRACQFISRSMLWSLIAIVPIVALITPFVLAGPIVRDEFVNKAIKALDNPPEPMSTLGRYAYPARFVTRLDVDKLPDSRSIGGAIVQWRLHRGDYVAVGMSLVFLIAGQSWRAFSAVGVNRFHRCRIGVARLAKTVGQSMLAVAMILIVTYCAVAPSIMERIDREREEVRNSLPSPAQRTRQDRERNEEITRIKSDPELIPMLEKEVDEIMARDFGNE